MNRSSFLHRLKGAIGSENVVDDFDVLEAYRRDRTPLVEAGDPAVLARPESPDDVASVVKLALTHSVPIVTRGAGSGLAGGANAIDGCVILSTERMTALGAVNEEASSVAAQAGVITKAVHDQAEAVGLTYPPDPASAAFCTIGGNIATNAGGLCCVKYGVTRDYVLSLEVVLGTGRLVRVGHNTRKDVAGYDVKSLLIGSEGTLAVITEATLRLIPKVPTIATVVGFFAGIDDAATAVGACRRLAVVPDALELMDAVCLSATDAHTGMGIPAGTGAALFARVSGGDEAVVAFADAMRSNGADVLVSTDPTESDMLFTFRKMAYPALERMGDTLLDDVVVAPHRIPDLVKEIHAAAQRHGALVGTFGHAGDGNLHPTIIFDRTSQQERRMAERVFSEIVTAATRLQGSVSGEHGIGLLKRAALAQSRPAAIASLDYKLKRVFDPAGILNPGKASVPPQAID